MTHQPLLWHQGQFLQPQHLQLADRWAQGVAGDLAALSSPYPWGVASLKVAPAALDNGTFQVDRAELVFADQTVVRIPENAVAPSRALAPSWTDTSQPLPVYLGLRKWDPNGPNVTVVADVKDPGEAATRFVAPAEPHTVADLHQQGPEAQVQPLSYLVRTFFADELDGLGDWLVIPAAVLVRDQDRVTLADDHVPPCLTLAADDRLAALVRDIRDQVLARARQLEAYKTDKGIHTAEFGAKEMVFVLALRTLGRYGVLLDHMLAAGRAHPWLAYGLLRQMVAELSTFSGATGLDGQGEDGKPLPAYDHLDQAACFRQAAGCITRLLDEITSGPDYVLSLAFDGTYFATDLPPAIFEGGNRFYLVVESEMDPAELRTSLESIAKVSCRESLPLLIARSLSGIGLTCLDSPPPALPRRTGALYFQVDHHHDQWDQVQKHRNLALYWDTAPEDLSVQLMAASRR